MDGGRADVIGNGTTPNGYAGRVSSIAVDLPIPQATQLRRRRSGGVWATTNFLTTSANGPNWIPLTDFGPNGLNISSIAVFGLNTTRAIDHHCRHGEANSTSGIGGGDAGR